MMTRDLSSTACFTHPERPAAYRCDGCEKALCEDCIEAGHRLLFCRLCGERALPVAAHVPATSAAVSVERARQAPYGWSDAFFYPLRGKGGNIFGVFLACLLVLGILSFIPLLGIVPGCFIWVLVGIVFLLWPGTLFAVVRTTAAGDNELPDWPDFNEVGDRLGELFGFLLIAAMAFLPGYLLLRLFGCGAGADSGGLCFLLLAVACLVAVTLWIPSFGAVGIYRSNWLALHLNLHFRAIAAGQRDFWITVLVTGLLILVGQFLSFAAFLFFFGSFIGLIVSAGVGMYAWLTGSHLVGLWFRRHAAELEAIYLG
jgi:hypothetical protein